MNKFVKIGGLYVRPDDVAFFIENGMNSAKSEVTLKDGTKWTVWVKPAELAAILNGEAP